MMKGTELSGELLTVGGSWGHCKFKTCQGRVAVRADAEAFDSHDCTYGRCVRCGEGYRVCRWSVMNRDDPSAQWLYDPKPATSGEVAAVRSVNTCSHSESCEAAP
jgi:hypothetical protein